jgi:hypothetical protein
MGVGTHITKSTPRNQNEFGMVINWGCSAARRAASSERTHDDGLHNGDDPAWRQPLSQAPSEQGAYDVRRQRLIAQSMSVLIMLFVLRARQRRANRGTRATYSRKSVYEFQRSPQSAAAIATSDATAMTANGVTGSA